MAKSRTSRATILAQLPAARSREARDRESGRRAVSVAYDRRTRRIMMELTSGFVFGFPASAIPALADATAAQLSRVELSPAGSALHWEELGADLSVAGLLLASIERSEGRQLGGDHADDPRRRPRRGQHRELAPGRCPRHRLLDRQIELPVERDGVRLLKQVATEVFTAYERNPKGPVFMTLLERTFGKEITSRTLGTVEKCAAA